MRYPLLMLLAVICLHGKAQIIKGCLVDKNTHLPLAYVLVTSASGSAFTNDDGVFTINITHFPDTIRIQTMGYKPLKYPAAPWGTLTRLIALDPQSIQLGEVNIRAKRDYLKDSLDTRKDFAKTFSYTAPKIKDIIRPSSTNAPFAFVTLDVGMLVGLLTKKSSPQSKLKKELLRDEQEKHIDRRFNAGLVARITQLKGDSLQTFINNYRPAAAEIDRLSDYDLILFIKDSAKLFRAAKEKSKELLPY